MERLSWDGYAAARAGLHGGFDAREAATAVRGWLRVGYGVGTVLSRLRVPPTAVTTVGLGASLLVPAAAARGGVWPCYAALLVVLAAVADTVDGAVAVIASRITRLGSVYDSGADRIGEASWAATFWMLGVPGPLAVGCCAVGWLHEYVRERASAAGMAMAVPATVGERPTRVLVVLCGLLLDGLAGLVSVDLAAAAVTFVATGWLMLGVFGLRQLLGAVRRSLG
jgi:CDP-diacylglycerol--glycerol-3-phosphate 3-phosphatidyltransferase